MARKTPVTPIVARRSRQEVTGPAPRASRSTPKDSLPGRKGSGKSALAKGLFVPPDKGKK